MLLHRVTEAKDAWGVGTRCGKCSPRGSNEGRAKQPTDSISLDTVPCAPELSFPRRTLYSLQQRPGALPPAAESGTEARGSFREGSSPTSKEHQHQRKDEGSPFLSRGLLKSQIFTDLGVQEGKELEEEIRRLERK